MAGAAPPPFTAPLRRPDPAFLASLLVFRFILLVMLGNENEVFPELRRKRPTVPPMKTGIQAAAETQPYVPW